jgi:hypothetical protein
MGQRGTLKGAWTTPGLVDRFTALHAENKSFAEIRDAINATFKTTLTRNACIGQARRLELPVRPKPIALALHARVKQRSPLPRRVVVKEKPKPKRPLTIYEVGHGDCRFPEGTKSPFLFCGAETNGGSSWCDHHRKIVFNPHKWERRV